MATVTPSPLLMKDATLTIGTDEFAGAVSSVALTPSTSVVTFKGLNPDATFTDVTAPTWTCDLTYAQDWDSTNSLSMYLFENAGETVEAVFAPKAGGRSWTVNIIITPGAVGGAVDSFATATVSLGVKGQPTPGVLA